MMFVFRTPKPVRHLVNVALLAVRNRGRSLLGVFLFVMLLLYGFAHRAAAQPKQSSQIVDYLIRCVSASNVTAPPLPAEEREKYPLVSLDVEVSRAAAVLLKDRIVGRIGGKEPMPGFWMVNRRKQIDATPEVKKLAALLEQRPIHPATGPAIHLLLDLQYKLDEFTNEQKTRYYEYVIAAERPVDQAERRRIALYKLNTVLPPDEVPEYVLRAILSYPELAPAGLDILWSIGSPESRQALITAVTKGGDECLRAVSKISRDWRQVAQKQPELAAFLVKQWGDGLMKPASGSDGRVYAICLYQMLDKKSYPILAAAIKRPQAEEALWECGNCIRYGGDESHIPVMLPLLSDEHPRIRKLALRCIKQFLWKGGSLQYEDSTADSIIEATRALLASEIAEERLDAVELMLYFGEKARPHLEGLLSDRDARIREKVGKALNKR